LGGGGAGGARGLWPPPGGGGGWGGGGGGGLGDGDGGGGSGTGIPQAEGDPSAQRLYDEGVAMGIRPRPKGRKPLLPAPKERSAGEDTAAAGSTASAAAGAVAGATGFEPDPADRVGAVTAKGRRLGPDTAEDAWMWEGVPPGHSLITRYQPGERRYYMGDNEGPSLRRLPPAWPPGQGPDA